VGPSLTGVSGRASRASPRDPGGWSQALRVRRCLLASPFDLGAGWPPGPFQRSTTALRPPFAVCEEPRGRRAQRNVLGELRIAGDDLCLNLVEESMQFGRRQVRYESSTRLVGPCQPVVRPCLGLRAREVLARAALRLRATRRRVEDREVLKPVLVQIAALEEFVADVGSTFTFAGGSSACRRFRAAISAK
jgi:hypothetical protein